MSDTWPSEPPDWSSEDYDELMRAQYKEDIEKITLHQILENSEKFPIEFPIETVRCKRLIKDTPESILEENINSVYPVVHEHGLKLYAQFLKHKRNFGSEVEKQLYRNMTLDGLVERLLTKRAVVFIGSHDKYMLLDGFGRVGGWEKIGTTNEEEPLLLKNCLSYDEIKLSALLSVSSATRFINVGDRNNSGYLEHNTNTIEQNGIIVGLIGARLEKPGVMEYQELVVTKEQKPCEETTVKDLLLRFYEENPSLYNLEDKTKFSQTRSGKYFNNILFQKRIALSIDTLLIEANSRATAAGKMAYIHVVGIGLGVWKISSVQNALFMDTFAKRIEFLSSTPNLDRIADICFSYIGQASCGKYKNGDIFPLERHENSGIRIHIFNRDPHEKLSGPCKGNLLVVSYAWDGNALPGNEFWLGMLAASGDPAAASSTQISELHNPHINPKVYGLNLRVATTSGLLTLKQYQDVIRSHQKSMAAKSSRMVNS